MIRGAIFDMDGTLIDSMGGWAACGEGYLRARGITPEGGAADSLILQGTRRFAERVQTVYGVREDAASIVQGLYDWMADYYRTAPTVREGVFDFLEALKAQGVRMCVATATARSMAQPTLERLGLLPYFERLFICGELHTEKTSPLIYDTARAFLGTAREETWVFEDALYAARTVKKAGYPLCGIADRFEPQGDKLREIADVYLTTYREAEGMFGAQENGKGQ